MPKYKRLIEQLQNYKSGLAKTRLQIRQRVFEIFYRYAKLRLPNTGKCKYPTRPRAQLSLKKWDIESDQIRVQWEESWPQGGRDGGCFNIPSRYLENDAAFKAYEDLCAEQQVNRETRKREDVRQRDLERLRILQEKYPECN